jgi:hypothetical protein
LRVFIVLFFGSWCVAFCHGFVLNFQFDYLFCRLKKTRHISPWRFDIPFVALIFWKCFVSLCLRSCYSYLVLELKRLELMSYSYLVLELKRLAFWSFGFLF